MTSLIDLLSTTKWNKIPQFYHVGYIDNQRLYFLFYKSNVSKQEGIYLGIFYSPENIIIPVRSDRNEMIIISKKKRFNQIVANELLSYAIIKWIVDNTDHRMLEINEWTPCVTFVESLVDL